MGSVRAKRSGEAVARWLFNAIKDNPYFNVELVDLKDWNLPNFEQENMPVMRQYDELSGKWSAQISKADAYIFVVPEYNHGYPGALKNALDHLYLEWSYKPAAFVGYFDTRSGGIRAIEQLKPVLVELQMVPIENELTISSVWQAFDDKGKLKESERYTKIVNDILKYLAWWSKTLKHGRENFKEEFFPSK